MTDPRDVARDIATQVSESVGQALAQTQRHRPLPYDLLESEEAILAVVDAPGATASDVAVRVTDHRVEVTIDRFREFQDDFEMIVPGRALALDSVIDLPPETDIDTDDATARLTDHGTLEIEIPKVRRGTNVPITVGSGADEELESDGETTDDGDRADGDDTGDATTDADEDRADGDDTGDATTDADEDRANGDETGNETSGTDIE